MPSEELKPCPFCGSPAKLTDLEPTKDAHARAMIECEDDDCAIAPFITRIREKKQEAIDEWNRRMIDVEQ